MYIGEFKFQFIHSNRKRCLGGQEGALAPPPQPLDFYTALLFDCQARTEPTPLTTRFNITNKAHPKIQNSCNNINTQPYTDYGCFKTTKRFNRIAFIKAAEPV